jgi:hypothetical protein
MIYGDYDYLVEQQRRRDEMAQAQEERILQSLAKAQPKAIRLHQHLIILLGSWMVALGCRLQTRYMGAPAALTPIREGFPVQEPAPCSS